MDAVVLLIFANFFALLVVSTATSQGMLRASVHRPRLFQLAVIGSAAATVPVDLYAVFHGTIGSSGANVGSVWACYSLLICVISADALLRGRARGAIDPQEG